jgi:hypothetical protein
MVAVSLTISRASFSAAVLICEPQGFGLRQIAAGVLPWGGWMKQGIRAMVLPTRDSLPFGIFLTLINCA